jgi:hypothetical protein
MPGFRPVVLEPTAEYPTEKFDLMIGTDLRDTFLSMKSARGESVSARGSPPRLSRRDSAANRTVSREPPTKAYMPGLHTRLSTFTAF